MNSDEEHVENEVASDVPEGLRRSVTKRKIAGVAGGIAERLDIDANIVRVVFVLLTCLWGLGAAIYLAMWALVPLSGTSYASDGVEVEPANQKRFGLRSAVLLAGAICLGLLFASVALGGVQFGKGLSLVWLIFLVVLAVLSLRRPVRRFSFTRFIAGLFIAFLSVIIVGSGLVLAYVSFAGVPFSGGTGATTYQPTSVTQVHRTYRMALGDMTLNLRGVNFEGQTVHLTATVAIGQLNVEVPPGVQVDLSAESGSNGINYYPYGQGSFNGTTQTGRNPSHLDLTVKVGIGVIGLFRAAPSAWLPIQ
jgi:phage shock protein PspC (stress-responsive transcriptional regulator)